MNDTRAACIKETPEQHRATIAHTKKNEGRINDKTETDKNTFKQSFV